MILRYERLHRFPAVFKSMTGLHVAQFDALLHDVLPRFQAAEFARLNRPDRQRAVGAGHPSALEPHHQLLLTEIRPPRPSEPDRQRAGGAGHPFALEPHNQILLTVIWLRLSPIHEVLASLFGVSDTAVSHAIGRVLPLLEASGQDTMRMPDPGRKRRRTLDALLAMTPDLVVVVDTFEQPVQRHQDRSVADTYYSGKKKRHTMKSQVAVDEETGQIVDVPESAVGPAADIKVLEESGRLE